MARPFPIPFTDDQVAWLDARYMARAGAHDCCPKCSGLRCLVADPCPQTDCPLRAPVELERAA